MGPLLTTGAACLDWVVRTRDLERELGGTTGGSEGSKTADKPPAAQTGNEELMTSSEGILLSRHDSIYNETNGT